MVIELNIKKHLKKGYGKGELKDYKPWIKVNHLSSAGRSHRSFGIKTNRVHHLLSDLELKMFNILDFSDDVLDIREQYPLLDIGSPTIEETKRIATLLGINHPQYQGENIVMTTDFLITLNKDRRVVARTVKPYTHLDKRVIEKFEIERIYWQSMGVDWGIVTDKELTNVIVFNNLTDLKESYRVIMHDKLSKQVLVDIFDLISRIYTNYLTSNLAAFAIQIDKQLQSEEGMSLRIIKFFMAIKATNFNIYAPLQEKSMLIDLQLKFRKDELLHKSNLAE